MQYICIYATAIKWMTTFEVIGLLPNNIADKVWNEFTNG